MNILTGALGTLIPKLAMLLTDEYKLQKGLRGEIMFLKAELESMQAALERLSEAPVTDRQIRLWARDVRELSYDMEDSIDKFMVRIGIEPTAKPQRLRSFIHRSLRLLTQAKIRHQIATDIKAIKPLVKDVAERRHRYKVDSVIGQSITTTIDPRLHGIYEESTKLVAMGGPRDELTKLLIEQGCFKLKVIPIVGVGGLGKTTLANVLFQQLRGQFECCAFVTVSQKPDLNRILRSILRQVSEQGYINIETWETGELINKIIQVLQDKRYFIVIDDIWDKTVWKQIKCGLVDNNCASRIITTTRVADVAELCCFEIDGVPYKLKPLSHDDSKRLFYTRIFGSEDCCFPELKGISDKILRKCDGVPLAIITISSLLTNKPRNINEWNRVLNSIGTGLQKCQNMENMRQILSISYYDLPSYLKPCLLYLSVFPEDCIISANRLIQRWIVEGFIQGHLVNDYELGRSYLSELINRSLIQPEYMNAYGGLSHCRVHDMVLDLIISLSDDENFITVLDGQQTTAHPKKIRRLCLQDCDAEGNMQQSVAMSLSNVRSLVIFPSATKLMPSLSSFRVLRVLDLEQCRDLDNHHIAGIGNLFFLRYLGLRETNISDIPNEIGKLHSLHTLDLSHTNITSLPPTIVHLKNLVRLYIEPWVNLPDGIGGLESLEVLKSITVGSSPNLAKDLGSLKELRQLEMFLTDSLDESCEKALLDSLCNLQKISNIFMSGRSAEFIVDLECFHQHLRRFYLDLWISRLPRWMNSSLSDLSYIFLKLNRLRQEDLQNLGDLPFLDELYLFVLKTESTGARLVIGMDHAKFLCLRKFHFNCDAMSVLYAQGALPRLLKLDIVFSVRETKDTYVDFDLGLENLHSVKDVTVRMLCSDSRVHEVDEADAAMQMANIMNPNHPSLDVFRHNEDEMIEDELEQILGEQTEGDDANNEMVLERIGPWGGDGGCNCDITVMPWHLETVQICCGTVLDAISFSYRDRHGNRHRSSLWGGVGGSARTINLGPSEYVIEVSGTYGPFHAVPDIITSLIIVTNLRSYGPFGESQGTPFRTRVKKNGRIVGFFARWTRLMNYVEAIGAYVRH